MRAPVFERMERQRKVVEMLRPYIGDEVADSLDVNKIHVEPTYCAEFGLYGQPASHAFLDAMFPRWQAPAELLHYTKMENLPDIARSAELWLFALRKRIDQGELRQFGEDHNLKGFFDTEKGEAYFKQLGDDIFYTSFAPDQSNEERLWRDFGGLGTGVRLKLRVTPKEAELRGIQYSTPFRTALMELNDKLHDIDLPPFFPWTISKIGGFYLHSDLSYENEVRLLIKRHAGAPQVAKKHGAYEYWPVPIGKPNPFCELELIEIQLGSKPDIKAAEAALAGSKLQGAKLVPAAPENGAPDEPSREDGS